MSRSNRDTHDTAPARSAFVLRDVALGYGTRYETPAVLSGIDVDIPAGRVTSIIGPNGSGKSTLLRALAGLLRPQTGGITVDGAPLGELRPVQRARRIGMLPQAPTAPHGVTVAELVERAARRDRPRGGATRIAGEVAGALSRVGAADLADRMVASLSGGQRQRVWLAFVLAQRCPVLLLDEPTTYLDMARSVEILELIDGLGTEGRTIVMVLHDLNLAARHSDELLVLGNGGLAAAGSPRDVLDEGLLRRCFGLEALVRPDPVSGGPMVIPVSRRPRRTPGDYRDVG